MQDDSSFTRLGKRFRGNIEDIEQSLVRYRADTPERFNKGFREPPMLLLDSSTQTTSPPEQNTLDGIVGLRRGGESVQDNLNFILTMHQQY